MPTLRDYVSKNLSSIVARSKLGVKLRPIVQGALLPSLGDKDLTELTPEAIEAWGKARMDEPRKNGSPRAPASVQEELDALEQILSHARTGKVAGIPSSGTGAAAEGAIHAAAPGIKTKTKRGTQRGR